MQMKYMRFSSVIKIYVAVLKSMYPAITFETG